MPSDQPLPIDEVIPDIVSAMAAGRSAVLVAPPGAGKTTRVPLVLANEPWLAKRKILVLEPRRLAARAAAERMASLLGEKVGDTVGLRARLDTRVGARTRIEVVTEGVFTRLILDDPELAGIGAILFDEFHERSLDADLGLALALDAQGALREDLRLLVMSATLDAARVQSILGEPGKVPVIHSEGRAFPVETRHVGRGSGKRIDDHMADVIRRAVREEPGSLLAFLPGQAEIRRTVERLREQLTQPEFDIVELYGALDSAAQRRAIEPAAPGRRKIVLATAIAQTSITIEGVRLVVDSGLERVPRYEPDAGVTRLETVRVSRATADQRRGRAGRTEPGVAYRLWDEPETAGLLPFSEPEIRAADLSGLLLDCAAWGATDLSTLAWLDPPPAGALAAARDELRTLGAIDATGALTAMGRALRRLPLPPRLARMIITAAALGSNAANAAAEIAAVLVERGLGGMAADLDERLQSFRRDRSQRAESMRRLAGDWARSAKSVSGPPDLSPHPPGSRASLHAHPSLQSVSDSEGPSSTAALLALAYPDRIAKARGGKGEFILAGGRGARLDETAALSREPFLVVAELSGAAAASRILLAARLDIDDLEAIAGDRIETRDERAFDTKALAVRARRVRRLGAITLENEPLAVPSDLATAETLAAGLAKAGLARLPWTPAQQQLRDRVAFLRAATQTAAKAGEESGENGRYGAAHPPSKSAGASPGDDWPDLSDAALAATANEWLAPVLTGATRLSDITAEMLDQALSMLLPYQRQRQLDREVPTHFEAPTGNRFRIDYEGEGAPIVAIRVQELYGLTEHPSIAGGRLPLTLHLLSPAHRPIQITRDLPRFWSGSWRDVKAEMRGRYPKHVWPDDPASAIPTARAKPRG